MHLDNVCHCLDYTGNAAGERIKSYLGIVGLCHNVLRWMCLHTQSAFSINIIIEDIDQKSNLRASSNISASTTVHVRPHVDEKYEAVAS